MKKVYVCSPFRGKGGSPSAANIALARRLLRAVFDAGHAPFAPHLLFPQILSENEGDLNIAFAANFTWLAASNEIWVWGRDTNDCSQGMKAEVDGPGIRYRPRVVWMPPAFAAVEAEGWQAEFGGREGHIPRGNEKYLSAGGLEIVRVVPMFRTHGPVGKCAKCKRPDEQLNREGWCLQCFSGGTV